MSGAPPAPLLLVEDAHCRIPTGRGVVAALGGVDLTLAPGEILGLVGESGSGKSTLAKLLIGVCAPGALTSGRVVLDGTDLERIPREQARRIRGRRMGIVFQDPMMALNPVVPIGRQIIEAPRHNCGVSREQALAEAIELLDQVGVPEPRRRLSHYPHQFSGGLRQRITIAMALACKPDILIADEATTALDVTVQRQILDLLARLAAERSLAMIMVSHDLSVVAGRTHRTAVMYAGRIVECGSTEQVFDDPAHPYTRALLDAILRMDRPPHTRLATIPGSTPDLARLGEACAFAPRCAHAVDCATRPAPPVALDHSGRALRCHYPLGREH